jgi:chromosome partitioning protein
VFLTPIVERAAFRDIFDYGGLLADLPPAQVSNLENARLNAAAFVGEALTWVRTGRPPTDDDAASEDSQDRVAEALS